MAAVRPAIVIVAALVLAACGSGRTPAEQREADDRAVAQVESLASQNPPPQPISPQPFLPADIERGNLFGAGCIFRPGDDGAEPVLLTRPKMAYLKLGGQFVRLASDPGSSAMPLDTWSRYDGDRYSVQLAKAQGDGTPAAIETIVWPGRLRIADPFGQPVYDMAGMVECGS